MKKTLILTMMLLTAMLTGCGNQPATSQKVASCPVDVAIVSGCRANQPLPAYGSDSIREIVEAACRNTGTATIIVNDGSPFAADSLSITAMKSGISDAKADAIVMSNTNAIINAVQNARAVTEEADTLNAIVLAARSFTEGNSHVMIVCDNGLSTCGYINFQNNLLRADPQTVVNYLKQNHALPDLTDVAVYWVGLGDVAGAQDDLTPTNLNTLRSIWQAVLTACGASVTFDSSLPSTNYDASLPPVTPIKIYSDNPIAIEEPDDTTAEPIILDETKLAFIADSTLLADADAAALALQPVADALKADPSRKILLCGTTATVGKNEQCRVFSLGRAEAVRDLLAGMGLSIDRITCLGLGYDNGFHIPDVNADGVLNENAGANRSVVILDASTSEAQAILAQYK